MRLRVDWTTCTGRGICAELLPELITPDDWGYPVFADASMPQQLEPLARKAVAACPTLALKLDRTVRS